MKKHKFAPYVIIAVVIFVIIVIFVPKSETDEPTNADTDTSVASKVDSPANSNGIMDTTGTLGDYIITVKSARLTTNYQDEPSIIITYDFTNNDDEATSFTLAVTDKVYQEGIECESTISAFSDDTYDSANQLKDIKSGVTLEVEVIYKLNNETSDIEVEVSELISFSKNPPMVTRTFSLNE